VGFVIGVIGNPNSGKTTLFNTLTGARQKVGNWPGVTVEQKTGHFSLDELPVELVDLPGTYSLDVHNEEISLDEKIARDFVLSDKAQLIVNIVDASNLERNLFLTSQLLEMKVPVVVVLNMTDVARDKGIQIDDKKLSTQLGCPVTSIVASKKSGIDKLLQVLEKALLAPCIPEWSVGYPVRVENAIAQLEQALREQGQGTSTRWLAVSVLEEDVRDARIPPSVHELAATLRRELEENDGIEMDVSVADSRYHSIQQLLEKTVTFGRRASVTLTDRIDAVVLNRFLGIPVFLGMMYLMFTFAINIGGAFIDFFDMLFGAVLVDGVGSLLESLHFPPLLVNLLAGGVGGGIQLVATFVPIIGFLYLFLSVIEDSGYMARAAFVMDRLMRAVGLPGKSFVPLIVGFGCNVPSVMASRTMETHKDRLLTISMSPFMSCGARLSVYALFVAAFFGGAGQNVVFALYLIGIVMAVLTGLVLKKTLFSPDLTPFVMELPGYHIPTLRGVLLKTWDRLKAFCLRAGKTIVIVFVALNFLSSFGTDGSFGHEDSSESVLSEIGRTITPVFSPLGITDDNWPATVGIFTGVFAKEAVVGTLNALYENLDGGAQIAPAEDEETLGDKIGAAFASVPANLSDVFGNLLDPLGLGAANVQDQQQVAQDQDVSMKTFSAMGSRFDGTIGAFAYLVFVLLYTPCVAVMGAMYREAGTKWMLFVGGWSTGLAYITGTMVYQLGTFSRHPVFSTVWSLGCLLIAAGVIYSMRSYGSKKMAESNRISVVNVHD